MSEESPRSPAPSPMRAAPSLARAILLFLVIFLAGGIAGSAVTIRWGQKQAQRRNAPELLAPEALGRFANRLQLTPEQRAKFRPALQRMFRQLQLERAETWKAWNTIINDTRDELRTELTPEQQDEFDRMFEQARNRLRRSMSGLPEGQR